MPAIAVPGRGERALRGLSDGYGCREVRYLALKGLAPSDYEYNYMIDGEVVADPYAKALAGREVWGQEKRDAEPRSPRDPLCQGI